MWGFIKIAFSLPVKPINKWSELESNVKRLVVEQIDKWFENKTRYYRNYEGFIEKHNWIQGIFQSWVINKSYKWI